MTTTQPTPSNDGKVTLTHSELATLLGGLSGATILSLTWTGGDPARYKRDHGRIVKLSRYSGMVNARYDRKKAKSLGIDVADVETKPVTWREREGKTPILRHIGNGTRYIEFYPASGGTEFTLDGAPCERDDVRDMLKPAGKGGGPKVVYRTPKLTSVSGAVIGGTTYRVVADPQLA